MHNSKHLNLTENSLKTHHSPESSNRASMKFLIDIFSSPSTAHIFYTNDANVLVDIIYRQVNDLSPGDEVAGGASGDTGQLRCRRVVGGWQVYESCL